MAGTIANIGAVEGLLRLKDQLTGKLRIAAQNIEDTGKKMERVGRRMQSVGSAMTSSVTLPLAAIGVASTKMAADFSTSMTKIETLVGINRDVVQGWRQDVLKLSQDTAQAPRELADAMFFITSAGLRGKDALEALKASAEASAIGLGETASIADAATSAMNAYGPSVLGASEATNILALAVRAGKLEASELAPVMGRLLPTASKLGIAFEDVAGVLAVMSRTGLDAAEASTSVNQIMSTLLGKSKAGAKALEQVGLSYAQLRDVAAKPGGLIEAMRMIDQAFQGNDEALLQVIPNIRAFRGVMNVLAQDASIVDDVMSQVASKTDVLSDGMSRLAEEAGFKISQFFQTAKVRLIELGDTMVPALESALETGTKLLELIGGMIEKFGKLPEPVRNATIAVGALAAAIGPLLFATGQLAIAWGGLVQVAPVLATRVRMLSGAFVDLRIAAAALIAIGIREWIRGWKEEMDDVIAASTATAMDIGGVMDGASEALRNFNLARQSDQKLIEDKDVSTIETAVERLRELNKRYTELSRDTSLSTEEMIAWGDNARTAAMRTDQMVNVLSAIRKEFQVVKAVDPQATAEEIAQSQANAAAAAKEHAERMKALAEGAQGALNALIPFRGEISELSTMGSILTEAFRNGLISAQEYSSGLASLMKKFAELREEMAQLKDGIELPEPGDIGLDFGDLDLDSLLVPVEKANEAHKKYQDTVRKTKEEWIDLGLQMVQSLDRGNSKIAKVITSILGLVKAFQAASAAAKITEASIRAVETASAVLAIISAAFTLFDSLFGGGDEGKQASSAVARITEAGAQISAAGGDFVNEVSDAANDVSEGLREAAEAAGVSLGDLGKVVITKTEDLVKVMIDGVTFQFLEMRDAVNFAIQELFRNVDTSELSEAMQQLIAGTSAAVRENLPQAIDFVRSLEEMAVGFSSVEAALIDTLPQFDRWVQRLQEFGLQAGTAIELAGMAMIGNLQRLRDQITGETRSPEEELKLRQQEAKLFNARIELIRAELEARRAELVARLELMRTGLRVEQNNIRGKAEFIKAELGLSRDFIRGRAQAVRGLGGVYQGELDLLAGFGNAAGNIIGQAAELLEKQINAIGAVLGALPEAINIAAIKIGKVGGKISGGKGGGKISDPIGKISTPRGSRRNRKRDALDQIERLLESGSARTFADQLAEINKQFVEAAKLDQKFGLGKLAELQEKYLETIRDAIEKQVAPVRKLIDDLSLRGTTRRGSAASFGSISKQFGETLAAFKGGDLGSSSKLAELGGKLASLAESQFGGARLEFFLSNLRSQLEGALGQDFAETFVNDNPLLPVAQEQNESQKQLVEEQKKTNEKLDQVEAAQMNTESAVTDLKSETTQILGKSESIQGDVRDEMEKMNTRLDEFLRAQSA